MSTRTTRATLSKRDANTLAAANGADPSEQGASKRAKKHVSVEEKDEFDTSDQEFDDEALIAAAEEAESAASNLASSQPEPLSSQPAPIETTPSKSTVASSQSPSATPRSTLRQSTLFASSSNGKLSQSSASNSASGSDPLPKLQPPSDPSSDPLWLERQTMSPAWFELLRPEMQKPYFSTTLKSFLASEDKAGKKTYPPRELIYSWSRLVPSPQHVRVVVVGQDPYHGPNQACGLSFSVPKGVPVPPSLRNMYKELTTEYPGSFRAPNHGCLDGWAKQGVLMLNACLTVSAGAAASHHGKGWEGLTKFILKKIAEQASASGSSSNKGSKPMADSKIASMFANVQKKAQTQSAANSNPGDKEKKEAQTPPTSKPTTTTTSTSTKLDGAEQATECKGIVFLVWGAPAAKTLAEAGVTEKMANVLILKSPHPSPLSAHRGFLGNGHFKKANDWLKQQYGESGMIDWSQL